MISQPRLFGFGLILLLATSCSKKENQLAIDPQPAPPPQQPPADSSGLDWTRKVNLPLVAFGIFAEGEFPTGVKLVTWDTETDFPDPMLEFGKLAKVSLSPIQPNLPLTNLVPQGGEIIGKTQGSLIFRMGEAESYGLLQTIHVGPKAYLAKSTKISSVAVTQQISETLNTIKPTADLTKQAQKQIDLIKDLESKGVSADDSGIGIKLRLEGKGLTDDVVSELVTLVGITELTLHHAESLTEKGFEKLSQFPNIIKLTLIGRNINDTSVSYFSKYKWVHTLEIEDHRLSDRGLNAFENYTNLRCVAIRSGRAADYIGPSKLSCVGVSAFRSANKLSKLELVGEHVSSLGFSSIGELKSLQELSIQDSPRAGQGINALSHFPNLKRLTLRNLALNDVHLKGVQFPALISLFLSNTQLQNPFPSWKTALPQLTHLQLDHSQINDATLSLIAECSLETLSLRGTNITDASFKSISQMINLQELYLDSTSIEGGQLSTLKGLSKLTRLSLLSSQLTSQNLTQLAELKTLTSIDLRATNITDHDLQSLASLENLVDIDLSGTRVKGMGLVAFKGLKALQRVRLEDASGTFAGVNEAKKVLGEKLLAFSYPQPVPISQIAPPTPVDKLPQVSLDALNKENKKAIFKNENNDRLKPIIEAKISGDITDLDLGHLRDLKNLLHLEITNAPKITDAGLSYLGNLKELESFTLKGTGVTGAGLGVLAQFTKLKNLNLEGIPLDPSALEILKQLKSLERVRITCPVEEYLELLTQLPNIKSIYLPAGTLTDRRVEMLASCKNLEELFLIGSGKLPITDRSTKVLEQFKNLNSLTLDSTQITDAGMVSVSKCENLAQLTLGKNINIKNPLAKLAPLKKLERLRLPAVSLGTDYSGLSGLENLHSLNLSHTDASDTLANALGQLKELEDLNLSSTNVSDVVVERLKNCPEIRIVNLTGTKVTGRGFNAFKDQEELRLSIVKLRESALTDENMTALNKVTSIEVLDLSFTDLSDAGIGLLFDLKRLKELHLEGCKKITDQCINTLKLFKNLGTLNVEGTSITADGIAQLKKLLPDCEIKGK